MRSIYQSALDVQDACNMSGVALSLANEIIPAVRQESRDAGGFGDTEYVNTHPAVVLFVAKMAELSGWLDVSMTSYSAAYIACVDRVTLDKARAEVAAAVEARQAA